MFYSGRMAAAHLLYLLDSSNELCKGLTKFWSSKNHLVLSSEFWKSVHVSIWLLYSRAPLGQNQGDTNLPRLRTFRLKHDYLYWCYTEVRAHLIAHWLQTTFGLITSESQCQLTSCHMASTPLQNEDLWRIVCDKPLMVLLWRFACQWCYLTPIVQLVVSCVFTCI